MSYTFFTHNYAISPYLCNAVDLAMAEYDHSWTMDDPSRGAVVPATFNRGSGSTLTLAPTYGVGLAWASTSPQGEWNPASESLSPFELCTDKDYYQYASSSNTERMDFGNFSGYGLGFYITYVFSDSQPLNTALDLQHIWSDPNGPYTFNPRLTMVADDVAREVVFTSSFSGGTPARTIPYTDNGSKVHVVTVYYGPGLFFDFEGSTYYQQSYTCYVDGEAGVTFEHNGSAISPAGTPTFSSIDFWYAARLGEADLLGIGYDPTVNRHDAVWAAINVNRVP